MNLGEAIRITGQKTFYTQEQFAHELDVALSTVNRWELGKAKPNMKAMKAIKAFCKSNGMDYDLIETAWLYNSKEAQESWRL